jgi:deoxyribonuclease-4
MHLSIAPRLSQAADRARALGCESLQIFSGNPRGWVKKPLDEADVRAFAAARKAAGLRHFVVHAPYLINPAAADETLYARSLEALIEDLARADRLGAGDYILHPGSHRGSEAQTGEARVAAALNAALKAVPGRLRIVLENTAGGANMLGGRIAQLGAILQRVKTPRRVGMCLDSCHALAAGYELRTAAGMRRLLDEIEEHVGLKRLRVLHVNDSVGDLDSHRDRHAHLGQGVLGEPGLRRFLRQPRFRDLPAILETPRKSDADDEANMAVARRLAGRRRRRAPGS